LLRGFQPGAPPGWIPSRRCDLSDVEDPIGRWVASNKPPGPGGALEIEWMTIVGVVANTPMRAVNEPPVPLIYEALSFGQGPMRRREQLVLCINLELRVAHVDTAARFGDASPAGGPGVRHQLSVFTTRG
jgi:hypothetical protein